MNGLKSLFSTNSIIFLTFRIMWFAVINIEIDDDEFLKQYFSSKKVYTVIHILNRPYNGYMDSKYNT